MSIGGTGRPDFGSVDATDLGKLEEGIRAIDAQPGGRTTPRGDTSRPTSRLATALAADGKFDVADASALVRDAQDFGKISPAERNVFVNLLRQHGSKITPAAAQVLANAFGVQLGRPTPPPTPPTPPVTPPTPPVGNASLTITGDQRNGISGQAKPGDSVEAINLTTAPEGRLHLDNTTVIARADAQGRFAGARLPDMREGDVVRMRTRGADGTAGEWVTIKVSGTGADTRNTPVNLERMDLRVVTGLASYVEVTHNTPRPLAEPGATLRFTNTRTRETTDVTVTDTGSLPAGLKLKGQAGDSFTVAGSDGKNNVGFATLAGTLRVPGGTGGTGGVDLAEPGIVKDNEVNGTNPFSKTRFTGPLFIDGPSPNDVRQGAIGNCYFPSALAGLAHHRPEAVKNAIKDNGDGTYTVRFYEYGDKRRPKDVKVDGDLWARSWGGPVYGSSLGGSVEPDKMELWFPLIEKAYATWKGGYDAIGHGGSAGKVVSEILGGYSSHTSLSSANKDAVFAKIKDGASQHYPMNAGTYDHDDPRYTNSGVYGDHSYSVLGAVEEGGKKYVMLRNPWGQSEPGWDGKNDGIFKLELDKFVSLYQSMSIVEG